MAAPLFQAMHVVGGLLMASQILPAQAAGVGLQVGSVLGSAGVSFVRVRNYMKAANEKIFAPRGLTAKIMNTKKMMSAVGFTDTDSKGKLKLPPLDDVRDLGAYNALSPTQTGLTEQTQSEAQDPRVRRLRALQEYITPVTFDVPEDTRPNGWLKRFGEAPLRWANNRQTKKMDKAREKSLKKREEKSGEVEREKSKTQNAIGGIEKRMSMIRENAQNELTMAKPDDLAQRSRIEGAAESELRVLEDAKMVELEKQEKEIAEIYSGGDKKLQKLYKKEEKIANRILWVVIARADGSSDEDYFQVGSEQGAELD
jgi:hypothetical protein